MAADAKIDLKKQVTDRPKILGFRIQAEKNNPTFNKHFQIYNSYENRRKEEVFRVVNSFATIFAK